MQQKHVESSLHDNVTQPVLETFNVGYIEQKYFSFLQEFHPT